MADEENSMVIIVVALHMVLRPFLLPEKEINICVGLADIQRKRYHLVLEKNIEAANGLLVVKRRGRHVK
ncbi:hypothetical protein FRC08_005082 [Ceratobasidium sp. 394]|nr:hypothetical protein FRC08_005082 [Ceratobasidium sp. 394]